ncbi:calmin [Ctenodactylus gundi]
MAAQEWDWFQREELIGQISDIRVQNLQVERENVQKRTFTRWINLHLGKCDPPLEVTDLFVDIQDGKILMALLEVLSGQNLLQEYKSSSHRIFRLNNIAKALKFLEDSNVKLVSIDAAEIADGNPSLVLGLMWNIILFFQIKELTGNLTRNSPSSSLSPGSGGTDSDSSYPPTPTTERNAAISVKDQRKAIKTLLAWVQRKTRKYGVAVQDFAGSWRSGLAFLAIIKAIDPNLVDMKQALEDSPRDNLEKAFSTAQEALHIPRLLEPEDIMVDTPDEQSIVTYVAQFLERFPELEAEDFIDPDKEVPIESTFVRIRETPSDQDSRVLLLTPNGERAYTINHDTSHPPPTKVFVCDQPESVKDLHPDSSTSDSLLSDTSAEFVHQIIDRILREVPGKPSTSSEPGPESSILATRKDGRRSNSLPIKKMVHFEADDCEQASCSRHSCYSPDFRFEGTPRARKEPLKQDRPAPGLEAARRSGPEEAALPVLEAASKEVPGVLAGASGPEDSAQDSSSCNGALESLTSCDGGSPFPQPPGDGTVVATTLELRVKLLTAEAVGAADSSEDTPAQALGFSSDAVNLATTSQAFSEALSPPETEAPAYSWSLEDTPADQKPEVHGKAKRKSSRCYLDEGEAQGPPGLGEDMPSRPSSVSSSMETLHSPTLHSPSEEGLETRPSPPLSKVSVIPHDLFYYPHYEVPLSAVLEAYVEGAEDGRNGEMGELERCAPALCPGEEEPHDCWGSCSSSGPAKGHPAAHGQDPCPNDGATAAMPASGLTACPLHEDHQQGECGHQSQESPNLENATNLLEENVMEESTSSKKKEKRKHMDRIESSLYVAPSTVQSSVDLEEDTGDRRVPSRTSHSDSSIYIRRHTNRSLESDHVSCAPLRSTAEADDRGHRRSTRCNTQKLIELVVWFCGIRADMKRESRHAGRSRKASSSGEAVSPGSPDAQSDSLTPLAPQPDVMYFILFLWLLLYCLLLFPQLGVARL